MAKKKGKGRRPQQANRQRGSQPATGQPRSQGAKAGAVKAQGPKGQPAAKGQPPKGQPAVKGQPAARGQPAAKAQPAAKGQPAAKAQPAAKGRRPGPERSRPTRAERMAAAERARRRRRIRNRVLIVGVVVVVAGALAAVVVSNRRAANQTISRLEAGSCQFDRRADPDAGPGRNHVPNPAYQVNPPAGGNHLANPAAAGIFTAQNTPPDGQLVHSMEHGYVVLWHKPDLTADALSRLREVADKYARDVLVVPRETLPKPVAATAWGRRLLCDDPDTAALDLFVSSFRNEGPEKVPHE